ncbi:MAG: hypothetical protein HQK54_08115 [Oligoflexales bacterium]|nr:hypothetical protein [Oligoflexales bacterium]
MRENFLKYSACFFSLIIVSFAFSCKKKTENSRVTFYDNKFFQFSGKLQDNLNLRSVPLCSPKLAARLGSLSSSTESYFRFKFYKVTYEQLDQEVNGSNDGKVKSVIDTGREMTIPKDDIESQKIELTPHFYDKEVMNDGHYLAILCENYNPCLPPSVEALNQYKEKFQAGGCGQASDGQLNVGCKEILFSGARDGTFFGITYPVTIKSMKFIQGDLDFVYISSSSGGKSGETCGSEFSKNDVIFESGTGPSGEISATESNRSSSSTTSQQIPSIPASPDLPDYVFETSNEPVPTPAQPSGSNSVTSVIDTSTPAAANTGGIPAFPNAITPWQSGAPSAVTGQMPYQPAGGFGTSPYGTPISNFGGSTFPGAAPSFGGNNFGTPANFGNLSNAMNNNWSNFANNSFANSMGSMGNFMGGISQFNATQGASLGSIGQSLYNSPIGEITTLGHHCFSKGTKIVVVDVDENNNIVRFGQKNVQDIAIGDLVYEPIKKVPYKVYEQDNQVQSIALYRIDIATGDGKQVSLTVSSAHPIISMNADKIVGITQVSNLRAGDKILYTPVGSELSTKSTPKWKTVARMTRLGQRAFAMRNTPEKGEKLYNFKLAPVKSRYDAEDVFLLANGIVTGDLMLQTKLGVFTQASYMASMKSENIDEDTGN